MLLAVDSDPAIVAFILFLWCLGIVIGIVWILLPFFIISGMKRQEALQKQMANDLAVIKTHVMLSEVHLGQLTNFFTDRNVKFSQSEAPPQSG